MRRYCILFLVLACSLCHAQLRRDSILLYERAIDRSLTLHRGQLRINTTYGLSLFSKRFNTDGNTIKLSDEGLTKVRYALGLEAKYGVNDFIEVNVLVNDKTESQRGNEFVVFSSSRSTTIHHETEVKGLDDVAVTVDLRAPFTSKRFDLVGTIGSSFPTAKSAPEKPLHEIQVGRYDPTSSFAQLAYHTIDHWGVGVPVVITGLKGKLRGKRWAGNASVEFRRPIGQSHGTSWKYQLYGSSFEYYSYDYNYQVAQQLVVTGEAEFQALPWIDTFLGFDVTRWSGGWTSATEQKVAFGDSQLVAIHGGLEILITHKLWMRHVVTVAASGVNTFAPFTILTTINYNIFP